MRKISIFTLGVFAIAAASVVSARADDETALVARGAYIVNGPGGCGNCHSKRGSDLFSNPNGYLAGGERFDSPVFTAYSRNLTSDNDTGIGTWTEAEIVRAIREGVTKEGDTLGPPMPLMTYNNLSDDDAKAIAAYLRTVKPVHNEVPKSTYKIPLRPLPAAKGVAAPPKTDKVAYGHYLVTAVAHCFECHTTPNERGQQDYAGHLGAGGFPLEVIKGHLVRSLNITPDKASGIGAWTDNQIKRAIVDGIDNKDKQLLPIMPYPYFKRMTADDLGAIVAYLRTIPAVKNKVEPNPPLRSLQE